MSSNKKSKICIIDNIKIKKVLNLLEALYPDAECALNYHSEFELLVAVVLSAQTTDKSVNKVTPELFNKYPSPEEMMNCPIDEMENMLRKIGMYRTKSKNLLNLCHQLVFNFEGKVPNNYEDLISLSGVGRKTANVVMSVGFNIPAIAVDTHVFRVSNRIGIVNEKDVLKTEHALMNAIPKEKWSHSHHLLIHHGRQCCTARNPKCENCKVAIYCKKNI